MLHNLLNVESLKKVPRNESQIFGDLSGDVQVCTIGYITYRLSTLADISLLLRGGSMFFGVTLNAHLGSMFSILCVFSTIAYTMAF